MLYTARVVPGVMSVLEPSLHDRTSMPDHRWYAVSHVSIEFLIPPITGCCLSVKGAPLQAPLCVLSMLTQMC